MNELIIREAMNATLGVGSFGIVFITLLYLIPEMKAKGWYLDTANKMAIAIVVYFAGAGLYRIGVSILLATDPPWPLAFELLVMGFSGAVLGLLCAARLLSLRSGNWGWFLIFLTMAGTGATVWNIG